MCRSKRTANEREQNLTQRHQATKRGNSRKKAQKKKPLIAAKERKERKEKDEQESQRQT
jgi:hypothetical protein